MVDELRAFWREVGGAARVSLVVALTALSGHAAALAGIAFRGPLATYYVLHLAVMALGFALFVRLSGRSRFTPGRASRRLPRPLVWATVACGLYVVAWFAGLSAHYGEGSAEARSDGYAWVRAGTVVRTLTESQYSRLQTNMAAVFSAAWLFAGLALALWHGWLDLRRPESAPSARTA